MKHQVPFYSQTWDLDKWETLGFKDREEASYWQESCCGILCLKMIVDSFHIRDKKDLLPSVKELIGIGLEMDAYSHKGGWSHTGLASFIRRFGYSAVAKKINIIQIKEELDSGRLVMASVKWGFTGKKSLKERILFRKYGGHLVVVLGYEMENERISGVYVHHTSDYKGEEWQNELIPIKRFLKSFTGRGVIVG
ncbi:MAG: hypothetical protein COU06_02650 [Candidatus Harrisonbacteria bacterium CG10_big_fil_rev_8_21_14_0_10_38_8]|uniref:Peptidase C39-like domain-containing protein n=1 Tax=Candidatus Harrisonbacteria bacterium CG10_big_fil_rev_8_21_14_0_10_38_8 TaxID=1974582 RepID=A0A2M6WJL8_9BACT|nr:MAG: hypothetical protein COU06_02650 [Candidatus Harrisonbacteria bacterium CG10_big_fil_rev_8_21_14_0_10_38_8]